VYRYPITEKGNKERLSFFIEKSQRVKREN